MDVGVRIAIYVQDVIRRDILMYLLHTFFPSDVNNATNEYLCWPEL